MPRERRFTDEQQAQLCARVNCHHRREMHHYGSRGCLAEKCTCLTFLTPPTVPIEVGDLQSDEEPTFTLRASKVAHYHAMHALIGLLMGQGAPEAEIVEVVGAMNQMLGWRLRNAHSFIEDVQT